jgi:hypothetical protein
LAFWPQVNLFKFFHPNLETLISINVVQADLFAS